MIKGLLVSINFIGILFYSLFFAADINVVQTLPDSIKAGEEVTVEVTVSRGDATDFAQIKLEIPDGITVTEKDNNGSSFTFKEGVARWVWYSLPSEEEFTFKYKLTADQGIRGSRAITGKFSYVIDNNTQSFVFKEHTISIDDGTTAATEPGDGVTLVGDDPEEDPEVDPNAGQPATLKRVVVDQGDGTFLVRLIIKKNDITGFGRAKEAIPEGFTASKGDVKGAIFSFVDQNAKFIWTELPAAGEFEVTYVLTADPGVSREQSITGEFSYLVDDEINGEETREASAGTTPLLSEDGSLADNGTTGDGGNTGDTGDKGTTGDGGNTGDTGDSATTGDDGNTGDTADNGTTGDTGDNAPPLVVTCDRTIIKQSDDRFKVEVTINKSSANGFARLKEDVPAGFTATEDKSASGRFTFQDNAVKYVWTMLPAGEQMVVTYFLQAEGDISGSFDLNGTLSYVENNDTKKVLFGPTSFEIAPPAIADNGTGDNGTGDNGTNGAVSTPNAETGIAYRVQILAAHKVVEGDYFAKKYNYNGDVNLENHEGWTKYTVGSYQQYKGARDERQTLTNAGHGFPGPFVAAYNDGTRTTVQEALMVSSQQWHE